MYEGMRAVEVGIHRCPRQHRVTLISVLDQAYSLIELVANAVSPHCVLRMANTLISPRAGEVDDLLAADRVDSAT